MQVNFLRKGVAVAAAIFFSQLAPVAQAQPDLDNAPKGDNPPARQRPPRPANGMGVPDEAIRKMMEMGGVPEVATQDAVLAYMKDDMAARRPLRELGMKLFQALRAGDINDDQMLALVTDYRAAQEAEKVRREQAQEALDAKVNYSQNPRLEAMLLLAGLIGDGGGLIGPGGVAGFNGRPNQRRNAQGGNILDGAAAPGGNAQAPNAQRREENRKKLLERFDKNANGQLDPDENAALKQWREERRAARQPKNNQAANPLEGNVPMTPVDPAPDMAADADDEMDADLNDKN